MKKPKFIRKGRIITTLGKTKAENTHKAHRFENEAKRASHRLQMLNDGALGRGTVKVI